MKSNNNQYFDFSLKKCFQLKNNRSQLLIDSRINWINGQYL